MPRNGWGAWTARVAVVAAIAGTAPVTAARAESCAGAQTAAASAPLDRYADTIVCGLNRERAAAGLAPLVAARRLQIAGWRHARDMRDHAYFSHRSRDGRSFVDRISAAGYLQGHEHDGWTLGETLAWSRESASQPAAVVQALMDSRPHRRVILDGRLREVGVGVVRGTPTPDNADGVTVAIDYGSLVTPNAPRATHAGKRHRRPSSAPPSASQGSGAARRDGSRRRPSSRRDRP